MGLLMVALLSFCYISFSPKFTSATTFDVTSYGAVGDGDTYDTDAFVRAWADLCGDHTEDPTLIIPSDKTFLIKCVSFEGPCNSPQVHIKLLGNITAPKSRDGWEGCTTTKGYLITFSKVDGLTIDGPGQIDGQGSIWWPGPGDRRKNAKITGLSCDCPSMLRFHKCNGLQVKGTRHINSPQCHISISGCHGVNLGNLYISAPDGTPNTDGINVSWSTDVDIHDSTIESGDDCVAISGGTRDINVTRILCGPGHGISIGSLGSRGYATVENIKVRDCNLTGTHNGVRIKTVPHGSGYARGILFENINLDNVRHPIIIDQHYCNNAINRYCPAPPNASAVKVSDVTYKGIYGSSASKQAIALNCSAKYNCTRIETNGVDITGDGIFASCENVHGKFIDTNPNISCN